MKMLKEKNKRRKTNENKSSWKICNYNTFTNFNFRGIFAYIYFETDLLKSNGQLFFKYLGQIVDVQDGFIDSQLIEYTNKKYTGKYEDSGNYSVDISMSGADSDMLQTLNDFNIEYSGKIDNTARKNEQDISINYSSDVSFPFKYKYANETLGLQTDYVSSQYVGIENNNLKEFVEKFGVTDTTNVPDSIDLFSKYTNPETINLTDEEREQVVNTYTSLLEEKLGVKEFSKTEENGVTSYSVQITNQEMKDLMLAFLETLKNDQIMMPKMEEMFQEVLDNMNQISNQEVTVQDIVQQLIDDINNSETEDGTNTITVSQTDRKLSAITLTTTNTTTTTELKITKTNNQGSLTYGMELNVTDSETQDEMGYLFTASYQGLQELTTVNETYQFGVIGKMDGEEQRLVYNLNCTDTFNDSITIEDYAEDEIQVLNDYDLEQMATILMAIGERIGEVNTMQMEEIGFSEYGNPMIFAFPLISSSMLIYNQAADVVDESSSDLSETEISAFNSRFIQYEGEQRGTNVRALLQMVVANNVGATDDNQKVEVTGVVMLTGDDTEVPTESINTGSTYIVEMNYNDEGRIISITITQNNE